MNTTILAAIITVLGGLASAVVTGIFIQLGRIHTLVNSQMTETRDAVFVLLKHVLADPASLSLSPKDKAIVDKAIGGK